jgi:hypothetical protein
VATPMDTDDWVTGESPGGLSGIAPVEINGFRAI